MYFRVLLFISLICGLFASAALAQGIVNGSFEGPPPGLRSWVQVGGVAVGGPGSGGTANSAQLGPSAGIVCPLGGMSSGIGQVGFNCGDGPTCWIKFDYRLLRVPVGSLAVVRVSGPQGALQAQLPAAPAAGAGFVSNKVAYPACGNLDVYFAIFDPGGAVNAIFRVDEVASSCGATAFPDVPELTLEPVDEKKCAEDPPCAAVNTVVAGISVPSDRPLMSTTLVVLIVVALVLVAVLFILRRRRLT